MRGVCPAIVIVIILAGQVAAATEPRQRLSFIDRSPLSTPKTIAERLSLGEPSGADAATRESDYNLAAESFEVVIPAKYSADVPHGVLVWMGVSGFPDAWLDVLARHKLIYCHANESTGKGEGRLGLPIDGVHNLKKRYNVDESRVYIAGFSAGAGMSASMLGGFPEVFHGALLLNGGLFYYARNEATVEAHVRWHTDQLDQLKRDVRIVLLRGERDGQYPPRDGKVQMDGLLLDGFQRVTLLTVPGLGHALPSIVWFEKGIVALDEAKPRTPPTTAPTTQPNPQAGQIAQANRLLASARIAIEERDRVVTKYPNAAARNAVRARELLQRVLDDYPTTRAAGKARAMLDQMDRRSKPPSGG